MDITTLGLGIDNLEAGGELKNPPENEEMASAASHHASDCSLDSDDDSCHCEYVDLDDTSYYGYDHELFEDDVEEEDLSYYRSSTQGPRKKRMQTI